MQELHSPACYGLVHEKPSLEWNDVSLRKEVCAVALMIQILDDSNAVSLFKCALKIRLLPKMAPRRQRMVLTETF